MASTSVVFVPATEDFWGIVRGSAIVAPEHQHGDVTVWVEGNLYGASNLVTFADLVMVATGRIGAPTVAKRTVPGHHLVPVASWDGHQLTVTEPALLEAWLGRPVTTEDLMRSR